MQMKKVKINWREKKKEGGGGAEAEEHSLHSRSHVNITLKFFWLDWECRVMSDKLACW